ncbi:MAG: glycosyltransferase family 1 protein [Chloroflexota bacterium]|nr:glycosyltransferase family 1 protein [Chloroflexota bacterium]
MPSTTSHKPIHIGLNAHLLSLAETYRSAGANQYIRNLLLNLPRVDEENRYTVFLGERGFDAHPSLNLRFSHLPTENPPVRLFWEQAVQPFALRRERVDLLHSLAFVSPLVSPCPTVVTIYDLSFLLFPEGFRCLKRLYLGLFTRISARRARRIIAISESTKKDIVRMFGVPPERVDVVYCGVDETFRPLPEEQVADFRKRHGPPERFILFVGTLEPRKNVTRLIEAYSLLVARHPSLKLVIGGAKGWFYENIFAEVERLGLQGEVLFPGFIPRRELPLWCNAAELFVYPSLYEGFGLPPLEAMACGTPVIASDTSSLPEVVGEGGMLVNPVDVEALAGAMGRVLSDEALRQTMSEQGLRRAGHFSWRKMARETVQVYRRAMEHGG